MVSIEEAEMDMHRRLRTANQEMDGILAQASAALGRFCKCGKHFSSRFFRKPPRSGNLAENGAQKDIGRAQPAGCVKHSDGPYRTAYKGGQSVSVRWHGRYNATYDLHLLVF